MIEIILIILLLIVVKTLGGLFVLHFQDKLHLILGFSAGAVLGVALFDLIPESIEMTHSDLSLLATFGLVTIGFCLYMIIDRMFSLHAENGDCHNPRHSGKMGATALVIHGFIDGLSMGLAFRVSPSIGLIVSVAILIHSFSDGINTVGVIMRDKGERKNALIWLGISVIVPIIGLIVGCLTSASMLILGLVLALFSGFFLYISASDLIPESHHAHPTIWTTIATLLGLLVIFLAISLSGGV